MDGARIERIVEDSNLDSVPGTLERGRMSTSNVERDGCSAARRTSIGPDTEAIALVFPEILESNWMQEMSATRRTEAETRGTINPLQPFK